MHRGPTYCGRKGCYTVEKPVATGGMGDVYEAESESSERVVVKTPKLQGRSIDDLILERLKVEAEVLKSLDHRNIVHYVDEGNSDVFFLVLEFVSGPTMKERYMHRPATEEDARRYTLDLLDALDYIHGLNIIHRDVNPKNLILNSERELVLIDFGAAKQGYLSVVGRGKHIGTPGYSAPEQFTTGYAGPSSDLYATGAVLFFLLTGKEPSQYASREGELRTPPHELDGSISRDLSSVVEKAMQANPRDRYHTAADMISVLRYGTSALVGSPHLILGGTKYRIQEVAEIGRAHTCDSDCFSRDFHRPLDVPIRDSQLYLSKHHARVSRDVSGMYWIEDLESVNHTAISRDGGRTFTQLRPWKKEPLRDGEIVATVYKEGRGPYITFTFRGGVSG